MIYFGVFATACATLVIEVALTRFFSIAFWYHFAFLVIGIALLGLGAGGTFLTLFGSIINRPYRNLSRFSLLFSLSIPSVFIVSGLIPFDPARISWDSKQILYIFLYSFILSIPFFFAGLTLSTAIAHAPQIVNKIYFSDLMGAALGSIAVSFLFSPLGGSGVIIFASFTAMAGSLFFSLKEKTLTILLRIASGLLLFFFLTLRPEPVDRYLSLPISPYKDLKVSLLYPGSRLLKTDWNAFSRVDVIDSPMVRYAPGLSLEYRDALPPQLGITVDGSGLNAITGYRDLGFIPYLPSYLPYYIIRPQGDVLIIEPGGGLTVLPALHSDVKHIDVVERNPILIRLIRDDFSEFSRDIYRDKRVKVFIEEGRAFLKKKERTYDLIEISRPGTISPTSTGLYGLFEDYTFTVEAFKEYMMDLKDDGFISITRYMLPPPREEVRILSLTLEAFRMLGIHDPSRRIAAIRSWGTITILIKKTPLTDDEIKRIREFCSSRRFDLVYIPGIRREEANIYNLFKEDLYFKLFIDLMDQERRKDIYKDYLFDLTPTTDDMPFFFHFFKLKKLIPTYHSMKDKWQPFIEGGYLIPVILIQSLILSFILILLPLFSIKGEKVKRGRLPIVIYFSSIGLGFMFIEIVMIQKFILFLGKPIYSVSLVLFSILISTATGSYFSRPREASLKGLKTRMATGISILILILLLYYFTLDRVFMISLASGFAIRALITFALLAPLGFFMGFPFPLGIRITGILERRLIPWAWASNGCASVVATSLAIMLALSIGFSTVLLLAGGIYLSGLMWVRRVSMA